MWKVSKYGVFSGPNTGKYRPEKTPYLDTFHAMFPSIKLENARTNNFVVDTIICNVFMKFSITGVEQ